MKPETSQNLQLASWRPGRSEDVNSILRAGEDTSQLKQSGRIPLIQLFSFSIQHTHIREGNQLCAAYQAKC